MENKLEQYGDNFQLKVIYSLINDKDFLINTASLINLEVFEKMTHKWVIEKTLEFYKNFHTTPTLDYFNVELQKIENKSLKSLTEELLIKVNNQQKEVDLEYIKNEFFDFCKNQNIKNAILESVEFLKSNKFDEIKKIMNESFQHSVILKEGHEYNLDIESRYREDNRCPIPFPWPEMTEKTQGGFGKGELILIAGSPGSGKSWTMIEIAVNSAILGKNVMFYTLELSEYYVAKRMDACLTNISVNDVSKHRTEVEDAINNLKGKIKIKQFGAGRCSLLSIENHLEQLKHKGFKPDLLIIDYIDLLEIDNKHENEEKLFTRARGLATELGIPLISPSQGNRTAAKAKILEGDNLAGSYKKLMIGDIVCSISRNRKDKTSNRARFHIMKNRFGDDGNTYDCLFDTSMGKLRFMAETSNTDDNEDGLDSNNVETLTNIMDII